MNTEQLERESDKARQDLSESLRELRERISPGQVVDQLLEYTRGGGGATFAHNLKRQAVNNPMSVTMIGAGLAWLLLSGDTARSVGDLMRSATSSASETGRGLKEDTAAAMYGAASDAINGIADTASQTSAAVAGSAKSISRDAAETGRTLVEFCREQPLVVAGIGVAVGAVLGALLPPTEAETHALDEDEAREQGLTDVEQLSGDEPAGTPSGEDLTASDPAARYRSSAAQPAAKPSSDDQQKSPAPSVTTGGSLSGSDGANAI